MPDGVVVEGAFGPAHLGQLGQGRREAKQHGVECRVAPHGLQLDSEPLGRVVGAHLESGELGLGNDMARGQHQAGREQEPGADAVRRALRAGRCGLDEHEAFAREAGHGISLRTGPAAWPRRP